MKQSVSSPISMMQSNSIDLTNIALITFVWIIMTIIVNPVGDFPLNDDWAYATSVKSFLETGSFELPGWAVANLLPQVLFGVLFCLPFGFSFTALRFSTLTLGLVGIIATYKLLEEISSNRKIALLGALLIAVNPIYFGLANTFMTDVPHYAVTILSLYFFCYGIKKDSFWAILIALGCAIISFLIRQVTAALFVGYTIAYIAKYKGRIIAILTAAFSFVFVPVAIQKIFAELFWPKTFGNYGAKEEKFVSQVTGFDFNIITDFLYFALSALFYLGCSLLPLLLIAFVVKYRSLKTQKKRRFLIGVLIFWVATIGLWLIKKRIRMPISHNVIGDWGMGPLSLRDTIVFPVEPIPTYLEIFWIIVTFFSTIGAAILILFILLSFIRFFFEPELTPTQRSLMLLNNSTAFVYFLPLGMSFFFDRYLIFLLPLSIIMVLQALGTFNLKLAKLKPKGTITAMVLALTFFTLATTHDYLSWNRIRWQALNELMQKEEVATNYIDGGFEFNGWHLYKPDYPIYKKKKERAVWWWVERDDYLIAFNPVADYKAIAEYPLQNWLPFFSDRILVLQKNN